MSKLKNAWPASRQRVDILQQSLEDAGNNLANKGEQVESALRYQHGFNVLVVACLFALAILIIKRTSHAG